MEELEIRIYKTSKGKRPFDDWIGEIKDTLIRSKVLISLERIKKGNFGDWKALGDGLYEIRIHHSPGIRIYYAKINPKQVLFLWGGTKGFQSRDIEKSRQYLQDYLLRHKEE